MLDQIINCIVVIGEDFISSYESYDMIFMKNWITWGGPPEHKNKYGIFITIQHTDERFLTNLRFKNYGWKIFAPSGSNAVLEVPVG